MQNHLPSEHGVPLNPHRGLHLHPTVGWCMGLVVTAESDWCGSESLLQLSECNIYAGCISTGAVSVSYYPEHTGHECELAHASLRKEQREHIASKLAAGIPFDDVLDSVHLRATTSCPTSLQFVTKKDLHNITRDFGIDRGEVLHRNDADSVAAWIEKTKLDPQTQNL